MIAALYVQARGCYSGRPDVDPWPEDRDARAYAGPWSVVAHPPCGPWGAYSKPTPQSPARGPLRGDDAGCFRHSHAWAAHNLHPPTLGGGWTRSILRPQEWVCEVDQGHYGHVARKPTWLLFVGDTEPPPLVWGASNPAPIGTGARAGNLESMSKRKRAATPPTFADLLVGLAHLASDHKCRRFDPDSDCPECQIIWAGMVDDMSSPGANVRVTLPPDVTPWYDEDAHGASWVGDVYQPNGDLLDVFGPGGDVEPVPIEYCRPWRVGRYTVPFRAKLPSNDRDQLAAK